MVTKLGHFGREIKSICKVLKCGVGEGWRRLLDGSYEHEGRQRHPTNNKRKEI